MKIKKDFFKISDEELNSYSEIKRKVILVDDLDGFEKLTILKFLYLNITQTDYFICLLFEDYFLNMKGLNINIFEFIPELLLKENLPVGYTVQLDYSFNFYQNGLFCSKHTDKIKVDLRKEIILNTIDYILNK